MPPFGNLYDMAVYANVILGDLDEITFTAGAHRELMRLAWADMVRLVDPQIVNLTENNPVAA